MIFRCLVYTGYNLLLVFFFSSRRRHTRLQGDWSSDVCSSDLDPVKNTMTQIPIPVKPGTPQAEPEEVLAASAYWGTEPISTAKATAHSLMMEIGRASCRERV